MEQKRQKEIHNRKLDEKYAALLTCLANMPKGNSEEKKKRFDWFKEQQEYSGIIEDLLMEYRPGAYEKLMKRNEGKSFVSSTGEYDTVAFMEALVKTVEEYDQDGEASFISRLGTNYKQKWAQASGEKAYEDIGVHVPLEKKKISRFMKLIKEADKLRENLGLSSLTPEKLREVADRGGAKWTKEDLQNALEIVNGLKMVSLDNADYSFEIGTEDNDFEKAEYKYDLQNFIERLLDHMEDNWKGIASAARKEDRRMIQVFITKDILIALKVMEQIGKRTYIRYSEVPAGDPEIYAILKPEEKRLYGFLFFRDYLDAAVLNENLYDVYANLLYPEPNENDKEELKGKYFDFSDRRIAKVLHEDVTAVSRQRKKYEEVTRKQLYHIFNEMSKEEEERSS